MKVLNLIASRLNEVLGIFMLVMELVALLERILVANRLKRTTIKSPMTVILCCCVWVGLATASSSPTSQPSIQPSVQPSSNPTHQAPTQNIYLVAGAGLRTTAGTGGDATAAQLNYPRSVWQNSAGVVFVTEFTGNCIRQIAKNTNIISEYIGVCASSGTIGGDGFQASSALLASPHSLLVDSSGNVYFSDVNNGRIRKVTGADSIISTVAGSVSGTSAGDGGAATSAVMNLPYGVWVNTVGTIYACEYSGHYVRRVNAGIIAVFAGTGVSGYDSDGGPATSTRISSPQRLIADSTGLLYIDDYGNVKMRTVNADGIISTKISSQGTTVNYTPLTAAKVTLLRGIAIDAVRGDIYFCDSGSIHKIKVIEKSTSLVHTVAGKGPASTSATDSNGDGGDALEATLYTPDGMFLSSSGTIYYVDRDTNKVRMIYSVEPTSSPSQQPSGDPTRQPTSSPSIQPTSRPTLQPSSQPTCQPTFQPSCQPSKQPTSLPSVLPTSEPSAQPSLRPSRRPTVQPSEQPSEQPSRQPSNYPSRQPSTFPSNKPSDQPSNKPSHQPASQPTVQPSFQPSRQPSEQPSEQPSSRPSVIPSSLPSSQPSVIPSCLPSAQPSRQPSSDPSCLPSCNPSARPSCCPSTQPTYQPTKKPSVSPSAVPSGNPTNQPTWQPISRPSKQPSSNPSVQPTILPTSQPSGHPTNDPTRVPTGLPSSLPSAFPTRSAFSVEHATLPGAILSVLGSQAFRIVLPYLPMLLLGGVAFSDISVPVTGSFGKSYVFAGGLSMHEEPLSVDDNALVSITRTTSLESNRRSASVVDVNGDGHADLLIGDPYNSRCYVLFGDARGMTGLTRGFTIFGENGEDLTGWSVGGAGDFNNDTVNDIIIGAPTTRGVGAVYVIYGRRTNNYDVYLNNLTESQGWLLRGARKSDFLGVSVINAGDVNGDKCDDIIFGAVLTSSFNTGAAYVIYGGRNLKSVNSTAFLSPADGFVATGVSYQFVGNSVSGAGDVNKDGFNDVIIGTYPMRASLTPSAYVIYGSRGLSDVLLSDLEAVQGFRIVGSGGYVSGVGDVNHDGYDDVLVGSFAASASQTSLIVSTNITQLLESTDSPTILPTIVRSDRPTVKPTRDPTLVPSSQGTSLRSPLPTRMPSTSIPTMVNTSAIPTFLNTMSPSTEPSVEPSEEPSTLPTTDPTEEPTVVPTVSPSALPTVGPTERPTEWPVTTTLRPTTAVIYRPPYAVPTHVPTEETTLPEVVEHVLDGRANTYDDSKSERETRYLVNATSDVFIDPSHGKCVYVIVPGPPVTLSIGRFNATSDQVDVSQFADLHQYSDLEIATDSIKVTLPTKQSIHFLLVESSNISARNFIFGPEISNKSSKLAFGILIVLVIVLPFLGVLGGSLCLYRVYGTVSNRIDATLANRKYIGKFDADLNGNYIFDTSDVDDAEIEDLQREYSYESLVSDPTECSIDRWLPSLASEEFSLNSEMMLSVSFGEESRNYLDSHMENNERLDQAGNDNVFEWFQHVESGEFYQHYSPQHYFHYDEEVHAYDNYSEYWPHATDHIYGEWSSVDVEVNYTSYYNGNHWYESHEVRSNLV